MASVRVTWTDSCPPAAAAFTAVSFHVRTSLAAGAAWATRIRPATRNDEDCAAEDSSVVHHGSILPTSI